MAKAKQLIQNKTTNTTENFMSIRCKMDGGKYFNRIQFGSFQHRSMATALRVQHGPGWITTALGHFGIRSKLTDEFTRKRKRKHELDNARKVLLKYKKRRLTAKYGQQTVNSSPDFTYGNTPAEPDVTENELKRLCREVYR